MAAEQLTLRVSDAGVKWVKETMGILGATQAQVIRALFTVGTHHPDEVIEKVKQFQAAPDEGVGAVPAGV